MADGKNEARALRILEISSDYRTLQDHIRTLGGRYQTPPDPQSAALMGYQLMKSCVTRANALMARPFNPAVQPGRSSATEAERANLQAIIRDASSRRFMAHKIYLQMSATMRWVSARNQVLQGQAPSPRTNAALRSIDQRLTQEVQAVTDRYTYDALRGADQRKSLWIGEDPSLEVLLASIRSSQLDFGLQTASVAKVGPAAESQAAAEAEPEAEREIGTDEPSVVAVEN